MNFDLLRHSCFALLEEIDASNLATTTYAALWHQSVGRSNPVIPCPVCWAGSSVIVHISPASPSCGKCGRSFICERAEKNRRLLLERIRKVVAPRTLARAERDGQDDAAVERLMRATISSIDRVQFFLMQTIEKRQLGAFWQGLNMLKLQQHAIELEMFSASCQLAIERAANAHRSDGMNETEMLELAGEVFEALQEIRAYLAGN